ncbi:methyltransferase [uncultured Thiohalocapsa sp.]|uniref:methyltransferase n=1 Tax=uncultured Thiohalocapsa sp. TaxID=768990 RepID=UPI0025FDF784|nr:methyltransferase [uncultured Thiohalocapsa sp.]
MQVPNSLTGLVALDVALRRGLIARLLAMPLPETDIAPILCGLLEDAGVVERRAGMVTLAAGPARDWAGRLEDLAARTSFVRQAAADLVLGLDDLCHDLPGFMARSETFRLFRYNRALATSPAALRDTRAWVSYVEALTREEAPCLAPLIPLDGVSHLLEVGGNTGLFAEALLARQPALCATVLDLPAVCAIGEERSGRSKRLRFAPGDARKDDWNALAGTFEAVLFKSMLHDWCDEAARAMLETAVSSLPAGGRIIICERGAWQDETGRRTGTANIANVVFAPFYRAPQVYEGWLTELGCTVSRQSIDLDMMFHVLDARAGAAE